MNSTVEWPMVEIGRYIYAISISGGAVLHLLDASGSRLAQIRFSEGGGSGGEERDGVHYWSWDLSRLPVVIDLLRNEKPCYMVYSQQADQPRQLWGVATGEEPIGEGEVLP